MVSGIVGLAVTAFLGWIVWQQYQMDMEKYNRRKKK